MAPLAAVTILAWLVANPEATAHPPTVVPPRDFVEYWSAARVHLRGGNPYDGRQLLPLEREAAGAPLKLQPTLLWTPPWTLPLYVPFAPLAPRPAHLLWEAVQLACVLGSAGLLWRLYDGPAGPGWRRAWAAVPVLVVSTFEPGRVLLEYGQNVGFILLGLAGFLALRRAGYPFAAGMVGALTAVKPHLLALFGVAVLLDGVATRAGRRTLLGGAVMVLTGSGLALLADPAVFARYAAALGRPHSPDNPSVIAWIVPLVGYRLRWALDPVDGQPFWMQFVPCAAGCLAVVPYWWRRRAKWDWGVEIPRLVLGSFLLAPYGGWPFDLILLLVPVVAGFAAAARSGRAVPLAVAVVGHLLVRQTLVDLPSFEDAFWFTPATTAWFLAVTAVTRPLPSDNCRPGGPAA